MRRVTVERQTQGWGGLLTAAALACLVLFSTGVRVAKALGDSNFDVRDPVGMLKSDPALLYYFTERIVESGGLPPDDFRADPLIEQPELVDVPATFTVGQEFLVAWCYLAIGGRAPLHVVCVCVMGLVASLALVGAWGLTRELTGSRAWGLFAAALWALLPPSYRTIGFVLVREDLSFPLFALFLWLAARASRVGTRRAYALAGLALAAALATWHAMGFFLALGALCLFAHFLVTGRNAFQARHAGWAGVALPVAAIVPATSKASVLLGPAFAAGAALWLAGVLARRAPRAPARSRRLWAALALGIAGGCSWLLRGGSGDYAHVWDLIAAKLSRLGRLPVDPETLSFDTRLLWQGPFETLEPGWMAAQLGAALLALPFAFRTLPRERAGGAFGPRDLRQVVGLLALAALPAAWLVGRTLILPALLLPALVAAWLAGPGAPRRAALTAVVLLGAQLALFAWYVGRSEIRWYKPPGRQTEIARMVRAVDALVPPGAPVMADFMSSTAILACARRPIHLQPKYETERSRRRAERFLLGFFHDDPETFRRKVRESGCDHLVVDRFTLWFLSRYAAGLPLAAREPAPGSAAAALLSQDQATLESIPGYELLYRSPPDVRQSNGEPYDFYRLYRLAP